MAEAEARNGSLPSPLDSLDPRSLILSQYSNFHEPHILHLTTESFAVERGPRFREYSDLRERKLRMKNLRTPEKPTDERVQNRSILTPPKKQVKFGSNFSTPPKRPKGPSSLAQSVPDFSVVLRKENQKPAVSLPPVAEKSLTPPARSYKSAMSYGKVGGGSKSANSAEKSGGLMARKSYANMEEFKGLAAAAVHAINGENRTKNGRGIGRELFWVTGSIIDFAEYMKDDF